MYRWTTVTPRREGYWWKREGMGHRATVVHVYPRHDGTLVIGPPWKQWEVAGMLCQWSDVEVMHPDEPTLPRLIEAKRQATQVKRSR